MRVEGISPQMMQKPQDTSQEIDTKTQELNQERSNELSVEQTYENEEKEVNEETIIHAIEQANKSVKIYDRKLEFSIHEKTKEIMVKVIDTSGEEEKVIREIPPEKVLDMVARLWEMAGILVDEKA